LEPRPSPAELRRAYAPETYARAEDAGAELGKRLDAFNARLARRADALAFESPRDGATRRRRVLDVGCGDGRFLAQMASLGWQAEGLETDPVAADLARRRADGAVIHGAPLEALDLPAARFDLVTLLHVLEHVPEPPVSLAAVKRVLRPGGALLLALPNAASLEAALFRRAWYHLDLPRHLWGFTPHGLVRLVESSGFAVTSLRYLPFLFAPQSLRTVLRDRLPTIPTRRRPQGRVAGERTSGGGAGRTRLFRALLAVSERLGRAWPGEIMELAAVKPAAESGRAS
jgi:SAM-dependent methyltransferase